ELAALLGLGLEVRALAGEIPDAAEGDERTDLQVQVALAAVHVADDRDGPVAHEAERALDLEPVGLVEPGREGREGEVGENRAALGEARFPVDLHRDAGAARAARDDLPAAGDEQEAAPGGRNGRRDPAVRPPQPRSRDRAAGEAAEAVRL